MGESRRGLGVQLALPTLVVVMVLALTSAPIEAESVTFFLDTHDDRNLGFAGPVASPVTLIEGRPYLISIHGTFSLWSAGFWATFCGEAESAPLYPSPGTGNGKVGVDAEWIFAWPETCDKLDFELPLKHDRLEFSLDGGESWGDLEPLRSGERTHEYVYSVRGEGHPIALRLRDAFTHDNYGQLQIAVIQPAEIDIDIKPGSEPNSINPASEGVEPVAVLSSETFDATLAVDRNSVRFGRTGGESSLVFCRGEEDVNEDGLPDLVCHFSTSQTGFVQGDEEGFLTARALDGSPLVGVDSVRIVPENPEREELGIPGWAYPLIPSLLEAIESLRTIFLDL